LLFSLQCYYKASAVTKYIVCEQTVMYANKNEMYTGINRSAIYLYQDQKIID